MTSHRFLGFRLRGRQQTLVALGTLTVLLLPSFAMAQSIDPDPEEDDQIADKVCVTTSLGDTDPEEEVLGNVSTSSGGVIDGVEFLFEGVPLFEPVSLASTLVDPTVRMELTWTPNASLVTLELANPVDPADELLTMATDITISNPFGPDGQLIDEVMLISAPSIGMMGTVFFEPLPDVQAPVAAKTDGTFSFGKGIESFEFAFFDVTIPASQVPEPSTIVSLLVLGLLGAAGTWRRQRRA